MPCPVRTVFGISLIPGIGCPVVTSSTICANEVGYGAGGSLGFEDGAGSIPPTPSASMGTEAGGTPFGAIGGADRALR